MRLKSALESAKTRSQSMENIAQEVKIRQLLVAAQVKHSRKDIIVTLSKLKIAHAYSSTCSHQQCSMTVCSVIVSDSVGQPATTIYCQHADYIQFFELSLFLSPRVNFGHLSQNSSLRLPFVSSISPHFHAKVTPCSR